MLEHLGVGAREFGEDLLVEELGGAGDDGFERREYGPPFVRLEAENLQICHPFQLLMRDAEFVADRGQRPRFEREVPAHVP
ncbi:hypothetical protein FJZ28_01735 [Candidatus Peregrinibacteria bacterium]|nr:hypothetical protein [Candidatus Peregrinibacteria bacterium]